MIIFLSYRINVEETRMAEDTISTLHLSDVNMQDSGTYVCKVVNPHGSNSAEFPLRVHGE